MNTYLFYDLETSGLSKSFDQILQFAAIRTDMMLNEIERKTIMVRLRPDVVYSPGAMITNRISIADSMSGVCEYEAVKQIHGMMNEFGTISLGYNTMGFDDEFLRFSFHRNLLPPYTHQYDRGCRRMDVLPLAVIFWSHNRKIINWPEIDGKPSLKLENLSSLNKLATGRAHDAMVDVEATVELARRFKKEENMWEYLDGCFIKQIDMKRIENLPESFQSISGIHRIGLMVGSEFGSDNFYQTPILSIGHSIPYSNQLLLLRLDQDELSKTISENISENTWVIRKKYGEPGIILPPLERYWKYIDSARASLVDDNIKWLRDNPDLFQEIIKYYREFKYPDIPDLDIDAALYQNGFLSKQEQELCQIFHESSLEEKIEMVGSFTKAGTRDLAARILCRNYPENLPDFITDGFSKYLKCINPDNDEQVMVDYKGDKRCSPSSVLDEIQQLKTDAKIDREQEHLLDELGDYLKMHFSMRVGIHP